MNSTPDTRASLLIRVRDPADQAAWHEFVEIYRPVILRLARQKGMQEADAEESRVLSISHRALGVIVMIAALGMGLLGMVLWQAAAVPDANESGSPPGAVVGGRSPDEAIDRSRQPQSGETPAAMPTRVRLFPALTTGHDVTIAYSADGKLIAVANANPTRVMLVNGGSRVAGDWKPSADILDAKTGKTVVSLKLTTADEDAVLAATERHSHVETTALAFSPDGKVVAVGTSIGQVKLFTARTGELVRSLDDEQAKLADKETPDNWKSLRRAIGSVASLAFSPDGSLLATCGGSFADFSEGFSGVERLGRRSTGPGRLKVWDVQAGTLKHDLVGHNNHANAVAFSPDGQLLASAGRWLKHEDWGEGVILWNPRTGERTDLIRTRTNGGTQAIAFSPDSRLLAICTQRHFEGPDSSTGGVCLVHVSTAIEKWLVPVPGWAKRVAFSPDGKSVAVLCGGSVRFLDIETGTMRHEIRPDDSQDVRWDDFAIAPQGHTLAIGAVDNKRQRNAQREVSAEVWSTGHSDNTNAPAKTSKKTDGRSGAPVGFITRVGQYNLHDGRLVIKVWEETGKIRWSATQPAKVTDNGTSGPETVRPNGSMSKESPWFVLSSSKVIWNYDGDKKMNVLTFGETGSLWKEVDLVPGWPTLFQPDVAVPKEVLDRLSVN
jgi:WD40 repeat protein